MDNLISNIPLKELKNNYSKISIQSRKNPVGITVNGKVDTVVLSYDYYLNFQ